MPRSITADDLADLLRQEQLQFAELLGTIHTLRFTGAVTLKFLNGEPQEAEFGRPHVVRFPRPGARTEPCTRKGLDTAAPSPPSSTA